MREPSVFVASLPVAGPVAVGALAGRLRERVSQEYGCPPDDVQVRQVPLASTMSAVKRVPTAYLPRPEDAPPRIAPSPVDEPVAPARRGDPETATKAAAAARRLGGNRRTEVLRDIVRAGIRDQGSHADGTVRHGITESEYTARFGGVPGGNSKRLGELVSGAWLYARGERPSVTTGSPQRVLFPTSGALDWVRENPA